jgi:HSP20 family protein
MGKKNEKAPPPQKWDPFKELDLWQDWSPFRGWAGLRQRLADEALPIPAIDVDETDEAYVVSAEVPGVGKDDVNVEYHDGVLTIHGEKRSERKEEQEKRRVTERHYGSFSRSFRLPVDADENAIEAQFKDGVLTVTVGRSGERKPRVVSIKD